MNLSKLLPKRMQKQTSVPAVGVKKAVPPPRPPPPKFAPKQPVSVNKLHQLKKYHYVILGANRPAEWVAAQFAVPHSALPRKWVRGVAGRVEELAR